MTLTPEGMPESPHRKEAKGALEPPDAGRRLANLWTLQRIARVSMGCLIVLAIALPWVVSEAMQAKVGTASFHEWLPENRPERFRYDRFVEQFGTDQYVLISWEGCIPEDPRLTQFRSRLQALLDQKEDWIESVHSGGDAMARLQEPPLNLSRDQAANRLQGFLIGPKGTTALIVRLTDLGVTEHTASMERLRQAADEVDDLGRGRLKMAGTVYEAYAVDEAAADNLRRLVLPSSLTALAVAIFFLRSWQYSLVALALAGLGQLFLVMLVSATGNRFSAVLIVLPTLVFMLTLSGAIHLLNYHRQISPSLGIWRGPLALRHGFLPTFYSALTTVLGMGSLATSQLAPVRLFGAYSAFGLSIATILLLAIFPAVCRWVLDRSHDNSEAHLEPSPDHQANSAPVGQTHPTLFRWLAWLNQKAGSIVVGGLVLLLASSASLLWLKPATKFERMFPDDSPVVSEMDWVEKELGPIASIELLLRFPGKATDRSNRPLFVQQLTDHFRRSKEIGAVFSPSSVLPRLSTRGGLGATASRAALEEVLTERRRELADSGVMAFNAQEEVWRLTLKVSALDPRDYGQQLASAQTELETFLEKNPPQEPMQVDWTGMTPVMHDTQVTLIRDLAVSFSTAFLLITPVMMLMVRSFRLGLAIMLPNVLPVTLVFGLVAWLGWGLDIASILTASVALGIAVDDTLHFVSWYDRQKRQGSKALAAIRSCYQHCGQSMLATTAIACSAMTPFLFSEFLPTRTFAILMIALLAFALAADLVVLPAILLLFDRFRRRIPKNR
ncbi:MAG: efflux RND transporter permease subunit [Pirellulaceae bacterium]|jgi:predicted RND superfamily exporter protein